MAQAEKTAPFVPSDPRMRPRQAVAGVTPPQAGEAVIRVAWPAVNAAMPGLARLGQRLIKTVALAPLGWLVLLLPFLRKISPGVARRYTLTNQKLAIQKGMKRITVDSVPLERIKDVRLLQETYDPFYRSATLEVLDHDGKVALVLPAVGDAEAFRRSILDAVRAWAPVKAASAVASPNAGN